MNNKNKIAIYASLVIIFTGAIGFNRYNQWLVKGGEKIISTFQQEDQVSQEYIEINCSKKPQEKEEESTCENALLITSKSWEKLGNFERKKVISYAKSQSVSSIITADKIQSFKKITNNTPVVWSN